MNKRKFAGNQGNIVIKFISLFLLLVLNSLISNSQEFYYSVVLEFPGIEEIGIGTQLTIPVFADIDGDNDLDLCIGNYDGNINIFTNDGNGNFSAVENLHASGSEIDVGGRSAPTFADLDEDNDLDMYIGEDSGIINVFLNDGSGNFSFGGNLKADGSDIDIGSDSAPVFADLDGDADLDLFVGNSSGNVYVFTNEDNGNFTSSGILQSSGSDIDVGSFCTPVFADLDGDDDLDLYIGELDGNINVFLNDGNGNFSGAGNLQADGSAINIGDRSAPAFADLDTDNDLDLYIGENDGNINIFINDGSGNFFAAGNLLAYNVPIDVGYKASPVFADLDKDNDPDLYIAESSGFINVFINDGSNNYTAVGNLQADGTDIDAGSYCVPAFADLDEDNDLDLYVGNVDGLIKVFTNDGSGNFSDAGNLQADGVDIDLVSHSAPEFADLDGDDDLDLYVGEQPGNINVFINNGNGNFSFDGNLQADGSDIFVFLVAVPSFADIDKDNDQDLYVGDYAGFIHVYTNNGSGSFSDAGYLSIGGTNVDVGYSSAPAFIVSDVNCFPDLYIGNGRGTISIYTISDTSIPIITSNHSGKSVGDGLSCIVSLPDYVGDVTANDNCDSDLDVTQSPIAGTMIFGAVNTVTLTVTDDAGNTDQVAFNVSVEDNTNPEIISTHNNQTVDADANCEAIIPDYTGDLTATDNCDSNLDVTQNPTAGTTVSGATNEITLTVTDDAGNTDQVAFNVSVEDNTNPEIISTHNNQTVDADANCEAIIPDYTGDLTATDNCDSNLDVTQNPTAGTTVSGATNEITLTVTDDAGNTDQVAFNVSVEDNTIPEITSTHNNQTVDADANCEAIIPDYTGDLTATDNCDSNLGVTQNPTAGTTVSGATNEITLTVTDDAGNTDQVTFNVTVEDNTNPGIICVENQEVDADNTYFYTVSGTEFDPTETTDNCEVTSIENDFNNTSTLENAQLPEGTTTIIWTITDTAGNENTCSFEVTVNGFVGIKTLQQNGISIHPNPTNEILNLKFANNNVRKLSISDITGKTIIEKVTIKKDEMIDLSSFENGIYLISIQTNEEIVTSKIIKR